jgi:hypothetical protein
VNSDLAHLLSSTVSAVDIPALLNRLGSGWSVVAGVGLDRSGWTLVGAPVGLLLLRGLWTRPLVFSVALMIGIEAVASLSMARAYSMAVLEFFARLS